jgi:circadian clock protein KaiC
LEIRSTGIAGLDEILGGGIIPPSTILIAGTAGTGRTTLGIQSLCAAAKQGESVLYIPITYKSCEAVQEKLSRFVFFEESIEIHALDRGMAERDPLSMLVDISNLAAKFNPDRVLIDTITPLGYSFPVAEQRRFTYSLATAIAEWDAIVYLTATMLREEIHRHVISDLVDGIIYLWQEASRFKTKRHIEILKTSGLQYLEGEHMFEITVNGVTVYPMFKPAVMPFAGKLGRIKTSIPDFDSMLGGGIVERSSTLIGGSAGTGKTTFGLHFIVEGARNGEPGVIVSFEETPDELIQYAANFGWDLRELEQKDLLRIIYAAPSEIYPNKHTLEIINAIEQIGARRIVVDGISEFDCAFENPVEMREHILTLIRLFKNKGLTSILTSETTDITGDIRISDITVSFIMDTVIILRHVEINSQMKKAFLVLKMRGSDHDKSLREYEITSQGIKLGKSFTEYTGILTGSAKQKAEVAYEPYLAGFNVEMKCVMDALIDKKEATIDELVELTGFEETKLSEILSDLVGLGFVISSTCEGVEHYRIVLTNVED